jgi:hypothetical protein
MGRAWALLTSQRSTRPLLSKLSTARGQTYPCYKAAVGFCGITHIISSWHAYTHLTVNMASRSSGQLLRRSFSSDNAVRSSATVW